MRKFIFLLVLLVFGSCDSDTKIRETPPQMTGHAPQIAALQVMPNTVTLMDGNGDTDITIQFEFADAGADIATVHVEMSDGTSLTFDFPDFPNMVGARGTHTEWFDISTAELGPCDIEIWLIDEAGNASNHLTASVVVQSPIPEITMLDPAEIPKRSDGFDLTVTGTDFLEGATVTWDGVDQTTTFKSDTEVVAFIPPQNLIFGGSFNVRVRNPQPTAGSSNILTFAVTPIPGPWPEPEEFPIRITEGLDGAVPNGPSVNGGLEWEGAYAVFASQASNLVAGDTNDAYDLFVRETCIGMADGCTPTTIRAVMGTGGSEPNGDIGATTDNPDGSLAVSFNARFVAFVSSASNLVPNDTNGVDDVFLVNTCMRPWTSCTPGVIRVSLGNDGAQSAMPASYPAVADDGRYVAFVSSDPNLVAGDTNGVADVFLRDTCRGAAPECTTSTTRVSVTNSGGEANAASGEAAFTGRYVAFSSFASNLVAGDTNGARDVFLHDTCLGEPGCVPSTKLVSVGYQGGPANGDSWDPQVSWGLADFYGHDQHGRFVVFTSAASNLVPGDTNHAWDVFERDLCAGEPFCTPSTTRISVTESGGQIAGHSFTPGFLRWDGETIAFVSQADGVVTGDTNGIADVYKRHHCPTGAPDYCIPVTERMSVGTGGAQTDGPSYAPRMSHCPFGAHLITYISEASNITPDAVPIPNDGLIYIDLP